MKLIHISDLHIGKRVNEFSMIDDQRYIFNKILDIIKEENPDAVMICGDIYDKSVPSEEAVALCNDLFTKMSELNTEICVISGNHDSAERLAFGSQLLKKAHIHISPVFNGTIESIVLKMEGEVDTVIYMLPFIKPAAVRRFYEDEDIVTYTDAVRAVFSHVQFRTDCNNVLMAHQFVTGAATCDSEELSVGGIDQVDISVFKDFDYVALGHIHGPQNMSYDNGQGHITTVRYCGTPLKYSFSEMNHKKSVTVVEFQTADSNLKNTCQTGTKEISIKTIELTPQHDLSQIKGTYEELTMRDNYIDSNTEDYFNVILTDEEDIPDAIGRLRSIYPNIMKLSYDNTRTRMNQDITIIQDIEKKTPEQLFLEFYEMQNNQTLSSNQQEFLQGLIEDIWT